MWIPKPAPCPDLAIDLGATLQDLVSRLTPDNPQVNNGVLQVAHAIFKRWRPLFRSDSLFNEINHVLTKFTEPLLKLFEVRSSTAFHPLPPADHPIVY